MAITEVGTATTGAYGASSTANKPTGVASGDYLLALVYSDGNNVAPTAPTGWTVKASINNASGPFTHYLYAKIAGASEPASYAWSGNGGNGVDAHVSAWRDSGGAYSADPFDQSSTATGTNNAVAPSITPTAANSLVILSAMNFAGFAMTPPTGYTELSDLDGLEWSYVVQTTATATGTQQVSGGSGAASAILFSVKPSTAGGSTTTTQTLTGVARITAKTTKTLTGTARLTVTTPRTLTATARITAKATRTLTSTARLTVTSQHTQAAVARLTASTARTMAATAHIITQGTTTRAQTATARITAKASRNQTSTARIQTTATKTQASTARIQRTSTATQTATAAILAAGAPVIGVCKVTDTTAQGSVILINKQTNTVALTDTAAHVATLADRAVNGVALADVAIGRASLTDN